MQGTKIGEVRVSKLWANVVGFILTVAACVVFVFVAEMLPHCSHPQDSQLLLFLAGLLVTIIIHEGLHGLGALWFGKVRPADIEFGFMWSAMMPYCRCKAPVTVRAHRNLALLPLWITGVVPLALLLVFPSDAMGVFAGIVIASCVGDVWIVLKLRPFKADQIVLDSPTEIGCDVYSPSGENNP